MGEITGGIGSLALQTISEATGNCGENKGTVENYDLMGYKAAMSLALNDANDRPVKINVHGRLVTLPTRSSNDSSAKGYQKL